MKTILEKVISLKCNTTKVNFINKQISIICKYNKVSQTQEKRLYINLCIMKLFPVLARVILFTYELDNLLRLT